MKRTVLAIVTIALFGACGRPATQAQTTTTTALSHNQLITKEICATYAPLYDQWTANTLYDAEFRAALLPIDTMARTMNTDAGKPEIEVHVRVLLEELTEHSAGLAVGPNDVARDCGLPVK